MSKTIIAVRHFGLGGRESLETAVTFNGLVRASPLYADKKQSRVKIPPKWFKDEVQKLNAQKYPVVSELTEVPTFFQRRNKDGKTVNAFEEGTWCKIHSRHSGNNVNTNFTHCTTTDGH